MRTQNPNYHQEVAVVGKRRFVGPGRGRHVPLVTVGGGKGGVFVALP